MQRHAVLELGNIIIPRLPGIIRIMQPDTQVQTKTKKVQIVTQAKSRAQSNLFREILQRKFTIRAVFIFTHQPYIAGIQEYRSMQVGNHTEAILDIGFYANITHVVDIGIFPIRLGRIAARTYTACRKGAHTVGTTDIELFRIRCGRSVAIRPYYPSRNTRKASFLPH